MQSNSRKLLLALPVSLLFSSLCWAQTAAIQGDVKGEDGKPLSGATIKIERTDIKQNFNTKTDKKGHYFYGGLGIQGTFNVSVEVGGKELDKTMGVKPQGATAADVSFDLQKAAAARAAAAGGAITAEQEKSMTPEQKAAYEKNKKAAEENTAKRKELNDAFNAGMDAENAKNWDVAATQFQKASELDPTQHVVWSHLGDALSARSDKESGDAKTADVDKAVEDYKKAVDLAPDNPAYHNNYALVLVKQGKIPDAQAELSKAASIDPTSAGKYYYNLGAVMANRGQNDAAGEAFQKSMASGYVEAYYQYGLVLVSKATTSADGKIIAPDGTVQAFQKYLQLAPTGQNAEAAKQMLDTLGAGIQTSVGSRPDNNKNKKK